MNGADRKSRALKGWRREERPEIGEYFLDFHFHETGYTDYMSH